MKTGTIERCPGIPVRVGGVPYLVGNGYGGKTRKLDAEVQLAARLLRETFGGDVEIRFNSDGESGGAWLVDGPRNSLTHNSTVGIGVYRFARGKPGFPKVDGSLVYHAMVSAKALKARAMANERASRPDEQDHPIFGDKAYIRTRGVRSALRWIARHTKPEYTIGPRPPAQALVSGS